MTAAPETAHSGSSASASSSQPPVHPSTPSITANAPAQKYVATPMVPFERKEKLDDENWTIWKLRITTALDYKGLWGIVSGAVPQPPGPDTDSAVIYWKAQDLDARNQLIASINNSEVYHIIDCRNCAQMWEALSAHHEPSHIHLDRFTIGSLWTMHATEDSDIVKHFAEMTRIRHMLIQNDQQVSDQDFKNILLETVPPSWDPFTSTLIAQDLTQNLTVIQLKAMLSEEYLRRKRRKEMAATAYAATSSSPSTQKPRKPCGICGITNHATRDCRWRGKNAPKCECCGRIGHATETCFKNPANKGKGRISKHRGEMA